MSNPLNKRFPRELRNNLGKYLGLFFLMAFAVAFTSGFLLAAGSIQKICEDTPETYALEDGRFACDFEPSDDALAAVEDLGVAVTPDFYRQVPLDLGTSGDGANGITARVYGPRTTVNLPEYAEGRAPEQPDEVAFDRVFMMENHGLAVGDAVQLDGQEFTICGAFTYPDYQALFEGNTSFMFDALTFTVATVTPEGYRNLDAGAEVFNYSFRFEDQSLDLAGRTDVEEDMLEALNDNDAVVSEFIDAQDNQGIGYALDDVVGDQAMWTVLLFVLIVIMAFVFVVLTGATIEAESSVIGTMLASGWRKRELVFHYMVLPTVIGLLGAGIGLAVGVNVLSDPMKNLYYHSYSLPPYHTIWDWKIVIITAVIPFLMLMGITLFGLLRKMRFTPLQFLRHEVSSGKRNVNVPLPERLSYPSRFRLRVLLRNASHFVTLFFGIMFASLLLLFGSCMLPVVKNYAVELVKTVPAPHEYVLKAPLELEGTDEEREVYAALLRIVEDRDRYNENRDGIEAAQRLQDNEALMDALERLQDNDELMDALDRLQENEALMDALDRLQANDELMDALERLQADDELMDALDRLQDKDDVLDALGRLQENDELMAALDRVQAGTPQMADMMLLQSLDEATRADVDLVTGADEETMADLQLLMDADEQKRADIDLVTDVDDATQADIDLLTNVDDATQADIDILTSVDDATQADIDLLSDVDDATQADIDLVRDMDQSLLDDIRLAGDIDDDAHVVNSQVNSAEAVAGAEKYAVGSVEVERAMGGQMETVTVYGIQPDSAYWTDVPVADGAAVAGGGLIEKTKAEVGEPAELVNKREGETYTVQVAAATENKADTSLYMTLDDFNRMFGNDADYFNAYASSQELVLDSRYLAQHVQPDDMMSISDQLESSMSKIMVMMMSMAVPVYLILLYLLTKTVIDRSARSISYMKVFGYRAKEVNGLYIRPITYWVLFSLVASLPLIMAMLLALLRVVFMSYAGNFTVVVPPERFALLVLIGMVVYAAVAFLHVRRIKAVPLELAMKVQE